MSNGDCPKLEILSNHYIKTVELLNEAVKKRDRLFVYLLIVIFLLLLYVRAPHVVEEWINSFLKSQTISDNTAVIQNLFSVSFIGTILVFGLLSLAQTYFQTVLHVERQYDYVNILEEELSKHYEEKVFTREGKHYQDNKSWFSSWTKFIFWILFPLLMLVFMFIWLVFLFGESQAHISYLIMDGLISVGILISMGAYIVALYKKK